MIPFPGGPSCQTLRHFASSGVERGFAIPRFVFSPEAGDVSRLKTNLQTDYAKRGTTCRCAISAHRLSLLYFWRCVMRHALVSLLLAALVTLAMLPTDVLAGPFRYRGGPWDRWVASGHSTANSTYYPLPTRDDPGIPRYSQSYYYPRTYSTNPNIPWEYSGPGRDDPPLAGLTPRTYTPQYSSIPWEYTSPSRDNPDQLYFYPRYPSYPRDNIPWKLTSPSRDNPE